MVSVLSDRFYEPTVSHEVLGTAIQVTEAIGDFVGLINSESCRGDNWFYEYDDYLARDPIVAQVVESVMFDEYAVVPTKEVQGDTSRAMSASIKLALNEEVKSLPLEARVLIIGAGYGNDVGRVREAFSRHRGGKLSIVLVEPDLDRFTQMKKENPDCCCLKGTLNDVYPVLERVRPFDLVVMTMSLQFLVGVENPNVNSFASLLSPQGKLVGSYFDHDSYFSSVARIRVADGPFVSVGPRHNRAGYLMGAYPTTIWGTTFSDPYVPVSLIDQFMSSNQLHYQVHRGGAAIERFGSRKMLKEMRVTSRAYTLVTIVVAKRLPFVLNAPVADDYFTKPGTHISSRELLHYRPGNYAVGIKRNGVCSWASLCENRLVFDAAGGRRTFEVPYIGSRLLLQFELGCTDGDWLLDVYDTALEYQHFMDRQRLATRVCALFISFLPQFSRLNEFVLPFDSGAVDALAVYSYGAEGLVLIPLSPYLVKGFSEVRYLKRQVTADVLEHGKIVERAINLETRSLGAYIRDRPDKTKPNPAHVVRELMNAPSFHMGLVSLSLFAMRCLNTNADLLVRAQVFAEECRDGNPEPLDVLGAYVLRPYLTSYQQSMLDNALLSAAHDKDDQQFDVDEDTGQVVLPPEYLDAFGALWEGALEVEEEEAAGPVGDVGLPVWLFS